MSVSKYAGVAGTWSLDVGRPHPSAESFRTEEKNESVFDPDHRWPVDKNDFKDGGKYRSIVKLQMRFEGQTPDDTSYAMGTGWLINENTIVTAGHNVFDWSGYGRGLGKAVHIKCYIGYHGRDSVNSPYVQCRLAKTIVTPAEWLASRENRHRDVSIIKVDSAFVGDLRPFKYRQTPASGTIILGVVGYPADKSITGSDGLPERGANMYEEFKEVSYTLEGPDKVLRYRISTFGGQSGAPVIRKSPQGDDYVIGTHVYGGGDKNQASTIGGLGNDLDSLLRVFTGQLPVIGQEAGVQLVKHVTAAADGPVSILPMFPGINPPAPAESFWGDLARIGQMASPFLGPLGAVASTALGAIVHATESSWDSTDSDTIAANALKTNISTRALATEATLQAVLRLEEGPTLDKVLGDMNKIYSANAPRLVQLAPQLTPVISKTANTISSNRENVDWALKRPANPADAPEGFRDIFENIFKQGVKIGVPILKSVANAGLDKLLQASSGSKQEESMFDDIFGVVKIGVGVVGRLLGESAFDAPSGTTYSDPQMAVLITKRALLGEAAFQAVSNLSPTELAQLQIQLPSPPANGLSGQSQPEGFFDFVRGTAQKIGGVLQQTMPDIIKAVVPTVVDTLFGRKKQESSFGGRLGPPLQNGPGLRPKKSLIDMLGDGTLSKQIQQTHITA